jgi:hypothetical protein
MPDSPTLNDWRTARAYKLANLAAILASSANPRYIPKRGPGIVTQLNSQQAVADAMALLNEAERLQGD